MATLLCAVAIGWPTELPSYPHYPGRNVSLLSGAWDFAFALSSQYDPEKTTSLEGLSFNRTQTVPGAWDAAWGTGLQHVRGVGVYRARVSVPASHSSTLHFGACSLFCRVYVDGVLLHNHTLGGYTPFWVRVPPSPLARRELVVLTSNLFSAELTPTQFEYYVFWGASPAIVASPGGSSGLDA